MENSTIAEKALNQYLKNIERAKKYNTDNPEKCRLQQKKNYDKVKADPIKYKQLLDRKKTTYQKKKEAKKLFELNKKL